jgi:TP901 family phage tail tape measure protein
MANTSINIDLKFTGQGLRGLESSLVSLTKDTQKLSKASETIFAGDLTSLNKTKKTIDGLTNNLVGLFTQSQEVSKALSIMGQGLKGKELNEATSGLSASLRKMVKSSNLEGLHSEYLRISRAMGDVSLTTKGLQQAFAGTTVGIKNNIENTISALKQLGTNTQTLSNFKTRLTEATTILNKTGDSTYLSRVNKDLDASLKNTLKLYDASQKLQSLQIQTKPVQTAVGNLGALQQKTASGTATGQDVTLALRESSKLYDEIRAKEKDLEASRRASNKLLSDNIALLKAQETSLKTTITNKSGVATPTDISAAKNKLTEVTAEITKLSNIKAPDVLDTRKINAFSKTVQATTADVTKLAGEAAKVKFDVNLSKALSDAKKSAGQLSLEMRDFQKSAATGVASSLQSLRAQASIVRNDIRKGNVRPEVAKEDLELLNKKFNLLKQLNDLQLKTNAATGVMSNSDIAKVTSDIATLSRSVSTATGPLGVFAERFKEIKIAVSGKITYDAGYDRITQSYEKQILALNNLINTKQKWASDKSLELARQKVRELEDALRGAEARKRAFDSAFSADPSTAVRSAASEVTRLRGELNSATTSARTVSQALTEISGVKWFTNIAQRALAYSGLFGGIYSVVNTIQNGLKYVIEYDQAIHTLSAVLDMSALSAARLEGNLAKLGTQYGGALKDINEAALTLGRAGIDKADVTEATEAVIKMARLTGDTFATSASAMITYKEVFGKVKDTNTGLTPSIEDLGNMLAYMANQSRMSTQDIGTFSNYALAAAKSSGMTADAVSAMAISFSNAGVNASTIGTQIRRFSSVLAETSSETVNFFDSIGVSQEMMMARMKMGTEESNKAMAEFVGKLKGLTDAEFSQITRGMDILALQSLTLLRNNADEFFRHLQKMQGGVEGEIDKANFITESYAITWEKLGNTLALSFNQTVGNLLPFGKAMVEFATGALNTFNDVVTTIIKNWDMFKTIFFSVIGVASVAAISRISIALASATFWASSLGTALRAAQATMLFMSRTPMGIVLSAAVIAAGSLYAFMRDTKEEAAGLEVEVEKAKEQIREYIELKNKALKDQNTVEAARLELVITARQAGVDKLTTAINVNSALLEAKNSAKEAEVFLTAFRDQTSSGVLTKVSGEKAQTALVTTIDSHITTLTKTLGKVDKDDKERAKAIRSFIDELELSKKRVQQGDFTSDANKKNMDKWVTALDTITKTSAQLSEFLIKNVNQTGTNQFKKSEHFDPKLRAQYMDVLFLKSKIDTGQNTLPVGIRDNLIKMSGYLANISAGTGKNYDVTSAYDSRPGNANSQHLKGAAVDIQGKEKEITEAAGLEAMRYIASHRELFTGIGQVILEKVQSGRYVLHMGLDEKGQGTSFARGYQPKGGKLQNYENYNPLTNTYATSKKGASATAPSLNNLPLIQDPNTVIKSSSGLVSMISDEFLQSIEKYASILKENFTNNQNITKDSGVLLNKITNTIGKIESSRAVSLQKLIDFTPTGAKEFAEDFRIKISKTKDPLEAQEVIGKITKEINAATASMTESEASPYNGVIAAMKKFVKYSEDIKNLKKTFTEVQAIGKLDTTEQTKGLNNKLNDQQQKHLENVSALSLNLLQSQEEYDRVLNNTVSNMAESAKLSEQILRETESLKTSETRLEGLTRLRAEHLDKIAYHNANNAGDKKEEEALTKNLARIDGDIATTSGVIDKHRENILKNTVSSVNAQTTELNLLRQINREYQDFANENNYQAKNQERLLRVANSQKAGSLDPYGMEINRQDIQYGRDTKALDEKYGMGYDEFNPNVQTTPWLANQKGIEAGRQGANAGKALIETINKDFDAVANTIQQRMSTIDERYTNESAYNQSGLDINAGQQNADGSTMYNPEEQMAIKAAQDELMLQQRASIDARIIEMERAKADLIVNERKRVDTIEAASFGLRLGQTQQMFDSMQNIAQTYYTLSGNKSKAAFKTMQALSVATTVIKTYEAAQAAYASTVGIPYVGPYLAPVAAAGAIAAGMQQVAQIKAQTFHTGGYVANDNRAGLRSDEVPAVLQTGEYVLSRNDMKAIQGSSKGVGVSAPTQPSEVVVVNSIDPSIVEQYLSSREGRQIINNSIKR